ncbi:MAG: hypothetical protein AAF739_04130 [Pseudomonadota bacterium]
MAYPKGTWWKASLLAATLGWLGAVLPMIAFPPPDASENWATMVLFSGAIFGLPIAIVATFFVGGPILWVLLQKLVSWLRAASLGALVPAIMILMAGLLSWYPDFYASVREAREAAGLFEAVPRVLATDVFVWPRVSISDGVELALFIAVGVGTALALRAVLGPGHAPSG